MSRKNVKTLKTLREAPKVCRNKLTMVSIKVFSRKVVVSERDVKNAEALKFELTPLSMNFLIKITSYGNERKPTSRRVLNLMLTLRLKRRARNSSLTVGISYTM